MSASQQTVYTSKSQLPDIGPYRYFTELAPNGGDIQELKDLSPGNKIWNVNVPQGYIWRADKSFFRCRMKITKDDGSIIGRKHLVSTVTQDTAPYDYTTVVQYDEDTAPLPLSVALSANPVACMFREVKTYIDGINVHNQNDVPTVDTALKRLEGKLKQEADFDRRHALITKKPALADGEDTGFVENLRRDLNVGLEEAHGDKEFDICWTPSFGIFSQPVVHSSSVELRVFPESVDSIKQSVVQALHDADSLGSFKIEITAFRLCNIYEEALSNPSNVVYDLPTPMFYQRKVQNGKNLGQQPFDIDQSTTHAMVWYQQTLAVSGQSRHNNRTIFRYTTPDGDGAVGEYQNDVRLDQLRIKSDNGQNYPQDQFNFEPAAYKKNMMELYRHNKVTMDLDRSPWNDGESLEEFLALGPYYITPVQMNPQCSRLTVYQSLGNVQHDGDSLAAVSFNDLQCCLLALSRTKVTHDRANKKVDTIVG